MWVDLTIVRSKVRIKFTVILYIQYESYKLFFTGICTYSLLEIHRQARAVLPAGDIGKCIQDSSHGNLHAVIKKEKETNSICTINSEYKFNHNSATKFSSLHNCLVYLKAGIKSF
jgi:hypothetical protein